MMERSPSAGSAAGVQNCPSNTGRRCLWRALGGTPTVAPGDVEYVFACRNCGSRIAVDGGARDALIDAGCAVCGTPVSADAFEEQ